MLNMQYLIVARPLPFADNTPGSDSEMPALEESSNNCEMNCESPPALENNCELRLSDSDSDSDSDPEMPALVEFPEDNYRFDNSILEIPGLQEFLERIPEDTVDTCQCSLHQIRWDNDYRYIDNYWYTPYRCYVCPFIPSAES